MSTVIVMSGLMAAPVSAVVDENPAPPDDETVDEAPDEVFATESETGLWIVRLDEAPLASYRGETSGLRATSPEVTGDDRLETDSAASVEYLDHLEERQDAILSEIDEALGRDVEVAYEYRAALNGMAVEVSAEEAAVIADVAEVAAVTPDEVHELDTDVSHGLISSAAIWDGDTATGVDTRGEGVIVGMLDTGVNPDHPSFAATDGTGYRHTNPFGAGNYVGVCDPDHPRHDPLCNDKLIGAWDYTGSSVGARDDNGHGSHTGSTIAGNTHDAVVTVGQDDYVRTISGVAPRANVISYKVCGLFGCFSSASVAAVDQAILDGVDVLNYSISGGDRPWNDNVDLAFLEAYEAGIFVAASAGNDGPGEGTVAKTAPWNASVAATTHQRVIANVLDVTGPSPVPPSLTGVVAVAGDGSPFTESVEAPIRFVGPVDAENQGCEPFEAGVFADAIALIQRGGCNFSDKIDNATDAGAVAVVVFNQFAGPPVVMGAVEDTTVPGVMVSNDDGVALRDLIVASPDTPVTVRLGIESTLVLKDDWADIVADFSARGPSQYDLLAPTFAAPGRNILAAGAPSGDDPVQYEVMQGTSMSSPHGAGAGALLKALHPDWSPAQIRSALAISADREGLVKEDGRTAADPFDVGSGRLNLSAAGRTGLVLDESHADFVAANPNTGGDPKTLNVPALVNQACDEACTWTREVTSVADVPTTYTASVDVPEGIAVTVTPSTFTIEPGATQSLEIEMDVSTVVGGDWVFGGLDLTTDATHGADGAPVSDAHVPIAVIPAEAEFTVDPTGLESLQDVGQVVPQALTITNTGGAVLEWEVYPRGRDCKLPSWVSVSPTFGTVDPGATAQVEVTFDSADMTAGEYAATLCFRSNDPYTPDATVDLALTVVEIPVVDVSDGDIDTTQPAGTTTGETFAIRNDGYGVLNWRLDDEDAGPSDERIQLLRDGVLLVPNSTSSNRGVMAFDPDSGELIDREFIPHVAFDPSSLYTPIHVLPKLDGTGFLLADQVRWVITEYDLSGNFRGIFAPIGGRNPEVMGNIRGMAWSPDGNLLVTVASADNAGSIVELDADGNYLGQYVPAGLDGLAGPWFVLFRDNDMLVSANTTSAIHSFSLDGKTANPRFLEGVNWPEQIVELDNGNILVANWSGSPGPGIHEYEADGTPVGSYTAAGSSYGGVHPLGNGNILVTTSSGVYEIDREGTVQETEFAGGRGRFVTKVHMPEAMACSTPDEVPWASVSAASGSVAAGEADEVTVTLDSTGLDAGTYRAQLCVTSDDPDMPLVSVPVQLTVTDEVCTTTVTGAHIGALPIDDGLTCLAYGSSVAGSITVADGASVFADGTTVTGPVSVAGAGAVEVHDSMLSGSVRISGVSGLLALVGNYVLGTIEITGNDTGDTPIVISGNRVLGTLSCSGNAPPPVNDGVPNEVIGRQTGQCADL